MTRQRRDDDDFDSVPNRPRLGHGGGQGGSSTPNPFTLGGAAIGIILLLAAAYGSWFIVREGYEGVVYRFGQAQYSKPPGLHFKTPFFDSVVRVDMREQSNPEDMEASTKDPMPVKVKLSQTWRVKPGMAKEFVVNYTNKERFESVILDRKFREAGKDAISQFTALDLITKRQAVSREIDKRMESELTGYPAVVLSTQIEDVDPPAEYRRAVVAKEEAREQAGREAFVLQQFQLKAQQVTATREAEAKGVEAMAKAEAEQIRLLGDANAAAAEKMGKALRENPRLVEYEYAKRWGGVMPTMMPSDKVPMLMQMPNPK